MPKFAAEVDLLNIICSSCETVRTYSVKDNPGQMFEDVV